MQPWVKWAREPLDAPGQERACLLKSKFLTHQLWFVARMAFLHRAWDEGDAWMDIKLLFAAASRLHEIALHKLVDISRKARCKG